MSSLLVFNSTATFYCEIYTQPAIACSKLTMETLQQGVKFVES